MSRISGVEYTVITENIFEYSIYDYTKMFSVLLFMHDFASFL